MSEEYSVGYSEGYQAGWNAAMDATPPAQPAPVPLTDEQIDALRNQYPPSAGIDFDVRCREFARAIEAELKENNT